MKPKISVIKNLKLYKDQIERLNTLGQTTYYHDSPQTADEWLERCRGADIICTGIFGLNSDRLYRLKNVFISLPFVGVEFLDKEKLKERNIAVSNSPGCNSESVAEWIVGMLLMYFRRLNVLSGTTYLPKNKILETATSLYGKKITILGSGHIGLQLKKICESLGMNVNIFKRGDDLLNLVKEADIIANCLSANPDTIGLLDRKFFFSLKKGSFFVSSSRQQIYNFEALNEALDKNILIGAADDAAGAEVGDVKDENYVKLLNHPKILVTPHIAWNTDAELRKANDMMIDNIEAWINKKPINLIVAA